MANRYSKVNVKKKDEAQSKGKKAALESETGRYDERQTRLERGAKIMAIIVILAMLVSAFLSAGVFLLR